jgi:hypothetical protein
MVKFFINYINIGATLKLLGSEGTVKSTLNTVMYANLGIQVGM